MNTYMILELYEKSEFAFADWCMSWIYIYEVIRKIIIWLHRRRAFLFARCTLGQHRRLWNYTKNQNLSSSSCGKIGICLRREVAVVLGEFVFAERIQRDIYIYIYIYIWPYTFMYLYVYIYIYTCILPGGPPRPLKAHYFNDFDCLLGVPRPLRHA